MARCTGYAAGPARLRGVGRARARAAFGVVGLASRLCVRYKPAFNCSGCLTAAASLLLDLTPSRNARGAADEFEVAEAGELGDPLAGITVGHDGRGTSPGEQADKQVTQPPSTSPALRHINPFQHPPSLSNPRPAWFLERAEVMRLPDGPTVVFPCHVWVGAGGAAASTRLAAAADGWVAVLSDACVGGELCLLGRRVRAHNLPAHT
jgi:hypothetical protein